MALSAYLMLLPFMLLPLLQSFAIGEDQEVSASPLWDGRGTGILWEERPVPPRIFLTPRANAWGRKAAATDPLHTRSFSVGPSYRHLDLRSNGRPSLSEGRLWEEMPIPISLLSEENDGIRASKVDEPPEAKHEEEREKVEEEKEREKEREEEGESEEGEEEEGEKKAEMNEDDWRAVELTDLSEKAEDNLMNSMKQGEEEEIWVSLGQSITDVLMQNGFPSGLLPLDAVESYSINDSGEFKVHMQKPCYARIEELIYYDTEISGKISYGSISDISGIQVKQLFFWVSVTDIRVDVPSSDYIYFYVGFISKKLPISMFQQVPECQSRTFEPRFSLAAVA